MSTPLLSHKSPFECLHNKPPSYKSFKVFGCLCYPWLRPYAPNKSSPRSTPCVFLGYSTQCHSYICLDRATQRVHLSPHIVFVEYQFPFSHPNPQTSPPLLPTPQHLWLPLPNILAHPHQPRTSETIIPNSTTPQSTEPTPSNTNNIQPSPSPTLTSSPQSTPPLERISTSSSEFLRPVTRSMHNIHKPNKKYLLVTKHPLPSSLEPTCVSQAMASSEWCAAMAS